MNCADLEPRPVLGPAGNKATMVKKQGLKPQKKVENVLEVDEGKGKKAPSITSVDSKPSRSVPSILKSNFSLNASCSLDASTDSTRSRASTGRISRRGLSSGLTRIRRTQSSPKWEKVEIDTYSESGSVVSADGILEKKRCAWVTPNTDPCYVAFHDEEWGVPIYNDKKLFELLSFCTALAEFSWPTILTKRHLFREVFLEFDPIAVSKLNEKKILAPGSTASSLLSEVKLRAVIENARQMCKGISAFFMQYDFVPSPLITIEASIFQYNNIIHEFGSFDKYIWSFVNHKPTVSHFRYPRQIPTKTSKADSISKDMVKRGFRGVGPTVVYSFMQVAGITNDHLTSCFRFHDCMINSIGTCDNKISLKAKLEDNELELARAVCEFSLSEE